MIDETELPPRDPSAPGGAFRVRVRIAYTSGTLAAEELAALETDVRKVADWARGVVVTVDRGQFDVVAVGANVRARSHEAAIERMWTALDTALVDSGLFQSFDVAGRSVFAVPLESMVPLGHQDG